ncbi:MAG: hypothetical protein JNN20_03565 [Betaproteobacteria bacterium]|nr:hypothetical protein [Betaproteobacteria bacterium]
MASHYHVARTATQSLTALLLTTAPQVCQALLPPPEVECCQRKDYQSAQCSRFTLDEKKCEAAYANWQETFRRFTEMQRPQARESVATKVVPVKIEARLFYHHSGTYSEVVNSKTRFWNVIIGEGGAKEPSNALRVDVRVKGEPGSFDPKARVTLDAVNDETGKLHAQLSTNLGTLSVRGEYVVTFLLQPTGCIPLTLTARIAGSTETQTEKIPFRCGE